MITEEKKSTTEVTKKGYSTHMFQIESPLALYFPEFTIASLHLTTPAGLHPYTQNIYIRAHEQQYDI